jgi:hypothetical protein
MTITISSQTTTISFSDIGVYRNVRKALEDYESKYNRESKENEISELLSQMEEL